MLNDLLLPMFDDGYYPQILVAEIKQDLIDFSRKIQANPKTESEIYQLADSTLLKINEMKADSNGTIIFNHECVSSFNRDECE